MGVTTVNHSKNFVNPSNPKCYTNGIESKWREVKRQLPSSGRYQLNEHLPIHCWLLYCKLNKKEPFWDLVGIVSKRQKDIMEGKWAEKSGIPTAATSIGNTVEQNAEARKRRLITEQEEAVSEPAELFRCGTRLTIKEILFEESPQFITKNSKSRTLKRFFLFLQW